MEHNRWGLVSTWICDDNENGIDDGGRQTMTRLTKIMMIIVFDHIHKGGSRLVTSCGTQQMEGHAFGDP